MNEITRNQILEALLGGDQRERITTEQIARIAADVAIRMYREERKKINEKCVITQFEAQNRYGRSVINLLLERGLLERMAFGTRDCVDSEGNTITKRKGNIYYRVRDIEDALDRANLYKGTKAGVI